MMKPQSVRELGCCIGLILGSLFLSFGASLECLAVSRRAPQLNAESNETFLQFASGDHLFGFKSEKMLIVASNHMLNVEFIGARKVEPKMTGISEAPLDPSSTVVALPQVIYSDLWDGITLHYEGRRGALTKSTYFVAPRASVDQIRLRYSVPIRIDGSGNLSMNLGTGRFCESAPIAWQDGARGRVSVAAAFKRLGETDIGLSVLDYDPSLPLVIDPILTWNTFLGGASVDTVSAIALDIAGNVYVVGNSWDPWGTPVNAFAGNIDTFVAKLSSSGVLMWSTFLGGADIDESGGIALDGKGSIFVTGTSYAAWGNPLNRFAGYVNAFVAKLDNSGRRTWHTFLGESSINSGTGIITDTSGNAFIVGSSKATWGKPVNIFSGKSDAFVAKLSGLGAVQWNTFIGGTETDTGIGIALDAANNILVAGVSDATWGNPRRAFSRLDDTFVAKLDQNGGRLWNTFLGGTMDDKPGGIAVDTPGNIYVTGYSTASWGTPINAYVSNADAYVAKLNPTGSLSWNTFLGGPEDDQGYSIAVEVTGNVVIAGASGAPWGKPANPFAGGTDAIVAKLSSSGALLWNTFAGSDDIDNAYAVVLDNSGSVFIGGSSESAWGAPVDPFVTGSADAFVAKVFDEQFCLPLSITVQPKNVKIRSGESATLAVVASGTPKMRYQWYQGLKGDTSNPAPGTTATTDTYITPPLTTATRYWVRVTNDCSFVDSNTSMVTVLPEFVIGSWSGDGVYYLNSDADRWVQVTGPASQIAAGDMDGDGTADLVGTWYSGVWVKYSSTGQWTLLASPAASIAVADFDNDGKADLLGVWDSKIWLRDSASGNWSSISEGAIQVAAGDMDGDGKADTVGTWPDSGVWVKYSSTGQWVSVASPAQWIAVGDMNADGKADLAGIWAFQIWVLDSASQQWSAISYGASQVALGDLDGDEKKDLIGIWLSGVWVKQSSSGNWQLLSIAANSIAAGRIL